MLPGNYTAEVSFAEDDCYLSSFTGVNVKIDKIATRLTSDNISYIYDEPVNLTIALNDRKGNDLTGKDIKVLLNGTVHNLTTDNYGKAALPITIPPGNYTAEVSFAEDDCYLSSFASVNVKIDKIATNLTADDISYIYDEPVNLTIALNDRKGINLTGKDIKVLLNGTVHNLTTDSKGKAILPIDLLPGNYTAEISFGEDMFYLSSFATVNVKIDKIATNLTAEDVNYIYDEPQNLTIALNDRKGINLTGKDIKVLLNGTVHNLTTDSKGQATLAIDLLPGNYTAEILFAEDECYLSTFASVNVKIDKIATELTADDISFIYDEPLNLTILLKDRKGNDITGKDIKVLLNGTVYNLTTDAKGQAILPIDLLPGNYTAEVSYAGENIYLPSSTVSNVVINKIATVLNADDISFVYENSTDLIVFLKDSKGNELKGKDILIKLDKKTYVLKTDSNGQVTLTVKSLPGIYAAEISFAEDYLYLASSSSAKVTVNKIATSLSADNISFIYSNPADLVVFLKDTNGKALEGKNISISVNRLTYTKTTDEEGMVTLPLDYNAGSYVASLSFAGDEIYLASTAQSSIEVSRLSTKINASNMVVYVTRQNDLVASLYDVKGNPLSGFDLVIDLDGNVIIKNTDDSGQVNLSLNLNIGTYTANINFMGSQNYEACEMNVEITILDRIATKLYVPAISTTYGTAKNLVITLKDENGTVLVGHTVVVTLNKKVYNGSTDKNGQFKISVNFAVKEYTANIIFKGNDFYKPSTCTSKVVVKKATPKITASSKTFKANAKTKKVTATLKNKNTAIKKVYVQLTINKKTYKAKTNSKGVATFNIKLTKKGKYNAVYKYAGNSNFKSATKKVTITIK